MVGLVPKHSDDVAQTVRYDSEICEVAGNDSSCYSAVHHLEHSESGLVLGVESLKDESGVEVGVRFDFDICCIGQDTVGVEKLEVTHVVEPQLVLILSRN